jgi:hypothetical protein
MEVWKDIAGYEGLYQVSNMGNVKTMPRLHRTDRPYVKQERLLNPPINVTGYKQATLYKDKKGVIHSVHKLVATAFLERQPHDQVVNHKDGNKQNNHVENLEWCTYGQNQSHAIRTGLIKMRRGQAFIDARVAQEKRPAIYARYLAGESRANLAKEFGVVRQTISNIINKFDCRLLTETFPENGVLVVKP